MSRSNANSLRNGPSEFTVIGNLKSWSVIGTLDRVQVPTLVIGSEYDEGKMAMVAKPFIDEIPNVKAHEFKGASHTVFTEIPEEYCQFVADYLKQN